MRGFVPPLISKKNFFPARSEKDSTYLHRYHDCFCGLQSRPIRVYTYFGKNLWENVSTPFACGFWSSN